MSWIENPTAHQNSPEARAELEAIRAGVRAEQHEALLGELDRYARAGELLPAAPAAIAEQHGALIGAHRDPARLAEAVANYMAGPLSGRFKVPPADTLGKVVSRYKDRFRSDDALAKFKNSVALELSHKPEADIVAGVVRLLNHPASNAYLKTPVGPSPQVQRIARLMSPWEGQLKTDPLELAAMWPDLTDPLRPTIPDVELERIILARLSLPGSAGHLRTGRFDPDDIRGPRAGVRGAAEQPRPAAAPLFRM